jgi:SAM-dependent methyltransferase
VKNPVKEATNPDPVSDGRLHRFGIPPRPRGLRNVRIEELSGELYARIQEGAFTNDATMLIGCHLQDALQVALDIHNNRLSRRRYRDLFERVFCGYLEPARPVFDGATIVELGCGSINPFGLLFLFLMIGARQGIAVDLDPIQDISRSARALAECAAMMLIDPKQLVGDYRITREQVLHNIKSFDLAKLNAGDASGIDGGQLRYCQDPMEALPLQDGEADLVISTAVLEHIKYVEATIDEMARITRKGGFGIHTIDGSDHHRYGDPACHPLELLTEAEDQLMVYGSNRIRPTEFGPLFERHGFEVIGFTTFERVEINATLRERLAAPFRSMSNEVLGVIVGKLVVRRL